MEMGMEMGIDISKLKFDVVLISKDGKNKHKSFSNDPSGFEKLKIWLESEDALSVHVCMEATGRYGDDLALFLFINNIKISVVNPAQIKAFAGSEGVRIKTDKVDAGVIARFCKAHCPKIWHPVCVDTQNIRDLYRCLQDLMDDRQRCYNRQEKLSHDKESFKIWDALIKDYNDKINDIEQKIKTLIDSDDVLHKKEQLIKSIKGIGFKSAVAILSELPDAKEFANAKEAAAFCGLTPTVRQSGSSLNHRGSLSKMGNTRLRKALYMPPLVATRYNPVIKAFYDRLVRKGKNKMVALCAAMRKLLHIIFGVLKHEKPFEENITLIKGEGAPSIAP